MRRCVIDYDGRLMYYLDHRNSMWKKGSWRQRSVDNAEGIVQSVQDNYGEVKDNLYVGNYVVEISETPSKENIGCVMNIFDEVSASWCAVIVGVTEKGYILSHPHITDFGKVGMDEAAYYMIGDAKLGGQDGNIMVEIPGFWHRWTYEADPNNQDNTDIEHRAFYGWQEHRISLKKIPGGNFFPKRYISAFEGVIADDKHNPQDGWKGNHMDTGSVTWESPTITTVPNSPFIPIIH